MEKKMSLKCLALIRSLEEMILRMTCYLMMVIMMMKMRVCNIVLSFLILFIFKLALWMLSDFLLTTCISSSCALNFSVTCLDHGVVRFTLYWLFRLLQLLIVWFLWSWDFESIIGYFFLLYAGRSNVLKQLSSHHRQNSAEGDLMEGEKNVSPIFIYDSFIFTWSLFCLFLYWLTYYALNLI